MTFTNRVSLWLTFISALISLSIASLLYVQTPNMRYYLLMVITTGIVSSVTFVLSKQLLKPLEKLIQETQNLAKEASRLKENASETNDSLNKMNQLELLSHTFSQLVGEVSYYSHQLQQLNEAYQRFVPQEFLSQLGQDNITQVRLGDQVQKVMTVLFCDIRSYSTITENLTPEQSFRFINEYLRRISPILRKHNGFVDKFIGDAIMAIFPNKADDAIAAAIDVFKELEIFNLERRRAGEIVIEVAMGIHTGDITLGTVGEENRMDGTVISDAVNIAARLEVMAKKLDSNLLISETCYQHTIDKSVFISRYMGRVKVKNKQRSIGIYEILDGLPENKKQQRIESKQDFEQAITTFYAGKQPQALGLFKEIIQRHGADQVINIYVRRCLREKSQIGASLYHQTTTPLT